MNFLVHLGVQNEEKKSKTGFKDIDKRTYSAPPPAGPIALKSDIAVMAMPLAAPLWC